MLDIGVEISPWVVAYVNSGLPAVIPGIVAAALAAAAVATQVGTQVAAGQQAKKGARAAAAAEGRREAILADYRQNMQAQQAGFYQRADVAQQPFDQMALERAQFQNALLPQLQQELQGGPMGAADRRALSQGLRIARRNAAITGGPGGAFQVASGQAIADMAATSSQRRFDRLSAIAFGQPVGQSRLGNQYFQAGYGMNPLIQSTLSQEGQSVANQGLIQQQGYNAGAQMIGNIGNTVSSGLMAGASYAMPSGGGYGNPNSPFQNATVIPSGTPGLAPGAGQQPPVRIPGKMWMVS